MVKSLIGETVIVYNPEAYGEGVIGVTDALIAAFRDSNHAVEAWEVTVTDVTGMYSDPMTYMVIGKKGRKLGDLTVELPQRRPCTHPACRPQYYAAWVAEMQLPKPCQFDGEET